MGPESSSYNWEGAPTQMSSQLTASRRSKTLVNENTAVTEDDFLSLEQRWAKPNVFGPTGNFPQGCQFGAHKGQFNIRAHCFTRLLGY